MIRRPPRSTRTETLSLHDALPICLIRQYKALLETEEVTLDFADEAIDALATLSAEINSSVENIGARRLHTVLEKLLEEISFTATDRGGERSEEHTSELQSLMRISYAVFCLKKTKQK